MEPIVDRFALVAGFSSPFPFEFTKITEGLGKKGYKPPPDKQVVFALDSTGGKTQLRQLFGEGVEIAYNQDKGHLTVSSTNLSISVKALQDVLKEIKRTSTIEPTIDWYEFDFHGRISIDRLPLDTNSKRSEVKNENLNVLLGMKTQTYTYSICAFEGETPTQPLNTVPNWFQLIIQPFVPNPRYYYVRVIYRRKDFQRIEEMIGKIPGLIEDGLERY